MSEARQAYSLSKSVLLNAFWVPLHVQDTALITIAVPAALLVLAPNDHVRVFAVIAALVSFVAMLVPPIAGAASDRLRRGGVPRRIFILSGAALDVACLLMLARVHGTGMFLTFLLLATLGANVSLAAYQALLPDIVPQHAWGQVSGVRSVAMVAGTVAGIGVAAGTLPAITFITIGAAIGFGALTVLRVPEQPVEQQEEHARISDWHDFSVVFVARAFLSFGMALLMTFVLYFFKDILRVANPSAGTGIVAAASLVGAIVSGLYLGWLSDRVPRKWVVAACGIPMALAAAGFGIVPQERWMFGFAFVFGIGFGGVLSTGWALAIDSVPKLRDVARDLGIWGIAQNFPAVVAPLIGGWLLSAYGGTLLGYRVLFFIAGGSFAIASVVVLAVGRRPIIPWWGIPLRYLAALSVRAYIRSVYRVRSWGTPVPLDGSLVIANHQIDQDLMAPISELSVAAGWAVPVIAASARMLFEPGFMAVRVPWLWRIFYNVNLGWLFFGLGLFPLENELQTRAIARWAWAVQRRHGVMPLRDIFKAGIIDRLGIDGLSSSDLFSARYFAFGQRTPVRISELQPVYRKELLDEMRVGVEEDLSRIESAVQRGATYCVTPEGEYTRDGAMLPFRGIWDRLAPSAHRVILIGISYDPFVGRRLSQLYRAVQLRNRSTAVAELQAARPVTVSALIARWLLLHQHPFTALELSEGVIAMMRALPPQLFIDPELLESPVRCVREALKRMRELGILLTDGSRYVLSERRRHPAFPRVRDIVAFQARFLEESIAGARLIAAPFAPYPAKEASGSLRRCQNK